MSEQAFGWVVAVMTPRHSGVPAIKIWYAAVPDKLAAIAAVKEATNDPSATFEIARVMSETLRAAFGLNAGEVRCFD